MYIQVFNSTLLTSFDLEPLVITLILTGPFVLSVLCYSKALHQIGGLHFASFFVLIPIFVSVYWFITCTVDSTCSVNLPVAYVIIVLVFVFFYNWGACLDSCSELASN